MTPEEARFKRLIEDIYATRDDEIQCTEAAHLIARSSDALLTDEEVRQRYPQLWHHLGLCPNCAEEYRAVMALARAEAEGRLPETEQIPPPPAEGESKMGYGAKDTIIRLFSGFSPLTAAALTRGEEPIAEPTTIEFPADDISITLDVAPASSHPQRRDLYCTVTAERESLTEELEGAPIWLQISTDQSVVAEKVLDTFGDALFENLVPAVYDLRLFFAERELRISHIEIP